MLIDDVKGDLAALRDKIREDSRVKADTILNLGDIVYQNMDKKDGLNLKGDYDNRLKYFVIVGKNSKGDVIGLCLINSDIDFYRNQPAMQKFQYILRAKNYRGILEKDSRLDCAQLFLMKIKKSVAVKAQLVGHLTVEDEEKVLSLVASCGFIDTHLRKVYRIGQK